MPTTTTTSCQSLENEDLDMVPMSAEEFKEVSTLQQEILQMVADGCDKHTILVTLCKLNESLLPNAVSSIMLKDEETGLLNVLCAPSVPQAGHDALGGLKPGPGAGGCGNAVYKNKGQYIQDAFTDERYEDLRQLAIDFNLCSCWSMPVRSHEGEAIGSFALSSFEHRSPSAFHKMLLDVSAFIVGVVLRRETKTV